jgi:flagellar basal body-associated protein FliL
MSENNNSNTNPSADQTDGVVSQKSNGKVVDITNSKNDEAIAKLDALLTEIDPDFLKNLQNLAQDVREEVEKTKIEVAPLPNINLDAHGKFFWLKKIWNKPKIKYSIIGFLLAVVLPSSIYFFVIQVTNIFSLPYKNNLADWASEVYVYPETDDFVLLFDEYKKPFYNLTLPELTVNLATMPGGAQSYGQISIHIEAQSQKNLDLLKRKEAELLDISQRVLERVTWQDLSTTSGKLQTKKNLVLTMNKVLGDGLVSEVYYHSFFTKK